MINLRLLFFSLFLTLAGLAPVHAALSGDESAFVQKLSEKINSIKTLQGEFTQIGPDGSMAEGFFVLDRPGKLLFRYSPPVRMDIIADGTALMIHNKKADTRDIWPISQTPLRFLLENNINLQQDSKVLDVSGDDDLMSVVMEETTPAGTGRITLVVSKETLDIRQWTVVDPQGLETTIALFNLAYGKPTDPQWFYINHQILRESNSLRR
jgi:outer membrane lipoprotein-sorting protein